MTFGEFSLKRPWAVVTALPEQVKPGLHPFRAAHSSQIWFVILYSAGVMLGRHHFLPFQANSDPVVTLPRGPSALISPASSYL